MKVELADVMVFALVVQKSGFSAAARELDLPPSAVSRRIKRLEDRVGFKLLHRTTRRVGLTAAGRVYYEHIGAIPRLLEDAQRAVLQSSDLPKGIVRIAAPPEDNGVLWAALRGFMLNHPDVDLEIRHSLDYIDLIEGEFDLALRGGAPPDSPDLVAQLMWDSRILLAASPEYLDLRGTPQRVEELSEHEGVCMDPWAPNALRRVTGGHGTVRVNMRNRIRANSLETARRAALDGLGIAPLLELSARADLERGALVEVLRGALPMSAKGWVVYPVGRERSAAAQALIDHLVSVADPPSGA